MHINGSYDDTFTRLFLKTRPTARFPPLSVRGSMYLSKHMHSLEKKKGGLMCLRWPTKRMAVWKLTRSIHIIFLMNASIATSSHNDHIAYKNRYFSYTFTVSASNNFSSL